MDTFIYSTSFTILIWKPLTRIGFTRAGINYYQLFYILLLAGYTAILEYHPLTHAQAAVLQANEAKGDPIYIGSVGAYSKNTLDDGPLNSENTLRNKVLSAGIRGMRLAFEHQNKYKNGIRGQPIKLVLANTTKGDPNNVIPRLQELDIQYSKITSLIGIVGESHSDEAIKWAAPRNITLIQPMTGVKTYYVPFSMGHINLFPSLDESLVTLIRYLVYNRRIKRIALMTDRQHKDGSDALPEVKRLCLEIGAEFVYHLKVIPSASKVDTESIAKMFATKPQAVISWLYIYRASAMTIGAVIQLGGPDLVIAGNSANIMMFAEVLSKLPIELIGNRIVQSLMSPLPSDTRFAVVRQFREEAVLAKVMERHSDQGNLLDIYIFLGYLIGKFAIQLHLDMPIQTAEQLRETLFSNKIITVDDAWYGPFSKECIGTDGIFCACHNGARVVYLGHFVKKDTVVPIPDSEYKIPVGSCSKEKLHLPAPLVSVMVYPDDETGRRLSSSFELGQKAAIVPSSRIVQLLHQTNYTSGSNRALDNLTADHIVTAFAGCVLDETVPSRHLTTIIDPFFEIPMLSAGFQRNTIYAMPTLDQEIFALAHHAAKVDNADLRLLSSAPEGTAKSISAVLLKSLHTFAVSTGGGATYVSSIQAGLDAIYSDSSIIIVHGIKTESDVTAVAAALVRNPELRIALPMAHVETWYSELLKAVPSRMCERILFATSLPNWGSPVAQSPAMESFFENVPPTSRSPTALRGFMTHRMLMAIAERIPGKITSAKLLDTLYMTAVIAIDADLVVGPFFGEKCTDTDSVRCETNVGARGLRVRTLSSVLPSSSSHEPASKLSFSSGRIPYLPLPNIIRAVILGIVIGIFVLALIGVTVFFCCCTGRSLQAAPKNSAEPFTIIFTDIQSSTSLWSEVPEAMAPALDHHHAIIRKLILTHRGYEVKTIGDAFMIAFRRAVDAVEMAVALQERFMDNTWPPEIDMAYKTLMSEAVVDKEELEVQSFSSEEYSKLWNGIRVRIGINTGFGDIKKDETTGAYDYYGTVVNTAARVEAAGHGGQVLMTRATYDAALKDSPDLSQRVTELGSVDLRGLSEPVELLQLHTVKGRVFLPLRLDIVIKDDDGLPEEINRDEMSKSKSFGSSIIDKKQKTSHVITKNVIKILFAILGKDRIPTLEEFCRKWQVKPKSKTSIPRTDIQSASSQDPTPHTRQTSTTEDESIPYINALVTKVGPIIHRKLTNSGTIGADGKFCGCDSYIEESSYCGGGNSMCSINLRVPNSLLGSSNYNTEAEQRSVI